MLRAAWRYQWLMWLWKQTDAPAASPQPLPRWYSFREKGQKPLHILQQKDTDIHQGGTSVSRTVLQVSSPTGWDHIYFPETRFPSFLHLFVVKYSGEDMTRRPQRRLFPQRSRRWMVSCGSQMIWQQEPNWPPAAEPHSQSARQLPVCLPTRSYLTSHSPSPSGYKESSTVSVPV